MSNEERIEKLEQILEKIESGEISLNRSEISNHIQFIKSRDRNLLAMRLGVAGILICSLGMLLAGGGLLELIALVVCGMAIAFGPRIWAEGIMKIDDLILLYEKNNLPVGSKSSEQTSPSGESSVTKLKELAKLKEDGHLSEEEFEAEKKKII